MIMAIVGRPNVGKSTLFNRLSRSRDALVDNQPGITRDRLYATINYEGRRIIIVDTGGLEPSHKPDIMGKVKAQVMYAIEEADRIIFMVDGRQGLMPGDKEIAELLRKSGKDVIMAVNKVDGPELEHLVGDFYEMGIERVYPISSAHGYGIKQMMSDIVKDIPEAIPEEDRDSRIRVAIIGKPNVGKSSLVNRVLGYERVLVSEEPGTTRDSVDTLFEWEGQEFILIDTAGLRRKARVKDKIEKFSAIKALRSIDRSHLAIMLIDATEGATDQDAKICGYVIDQAKGLVIGINKWDLIRDSEYKRKRLEYSIQERLKFLPNVPIVKISALTGYNIKRLLNAVILTFNQLSTRVSTGELNRAFHDIVKMHSPEFSSKGRLRFYYITQVGIRPPSFVLFTNRPDDIRPSYKRFISNKLREYLGMDMIPIRLIFRKRR